jgi:hypothetical protein
MLPIRWPCRDISPGSFVARQLRGSMAPKIDAVGQPLLQEALERRAQSYRAQSYRGDMLPLSAGGKDLVEVSVAARSG